MNDKAAIGLRAQDFHEALRDTATFGPKEAHFGRTLLIGKAATLAMHLKGHLCIQDYEALQYAAAELGIGSVELPVVLSKLELIDFVSIKRSGEDIQRIDIRVPEFRKGYEELGDLWSQSKPSEVERAGLSLLDQLLVRPVPRQALQAFDLDTTGESILLDVMEAGRLIDSQVISGEATLFSPLAVDSNPLAYLEWSARFKDKTAELLTTLKSTQGLPASSDLVSQNDSLNAAILMGVLMPVTISGSTGEQRFLFAPRGGLSQDQRVILDKARAILACVRYGQHFSKGRAIRFPRLILERLKTHKKFNRGHPDLESQYGLLVEKFIGFPFKDDGGHWNFQVVDTPENMKALDVAIEMLEFGETPGASISLEAQQAMLQPHSYRSPVTTRSSLGLRSVGAFEADPRSVPRRELAPDAGLPAAFLVRGPDICRYTHTSWSVDNSW